MLIRTIEPKSLYNCVRQKSGATTEFRFLPGKKKSGAKKKHAMKSLKILTALASKSRVLFRFQRRRSASYCQGSDQAPSATKNFRLKYQRCNGNAILKSYTTIWVVLKEIQVDIFCMIKSWYERFSKQNRRYVTYCNYKTTNEPHETSRFKSRLDWISQVSRHAWKEQLKSFKI